MKKKFYNIFFTSESNDYRKSFRLSGFLLLFILLFGIFILVFASFGFYQFFSKNSLNIELKTVKMENFTLRSNSELDDSLFMSKNFSIPVSGFVSKGINQIKKHNGIDIAAVKGDWIRPTLDGIVVFSGYDSIMGNTIIISHSDNIFSLYAHNDTNLVNIREFVDSNTHIARIGDSGVSGGPHLHFEIWQGNKILDPRDLINSYKVNDVSIE